jgi:integrase/recombinase XerD
MTKHCADRSYIPASYRGLQKVDPHDFALIRNDFDVYLRGLGYSPYTVAFYQRRLLRLANWLGEHRHRPRMTELTRKAVPHLLNRFLPGRCPNTLACFRRPLLQWLRFQGRFARPAAQVGWQAWLDDYLHFLRTHRGVADTTILRAQANVSALLKVLFGSGKANWAWVQPADLWRFALQHTRGVSPSYAEERLGQVRRFMQFVVMQGACSQRLLTAFPKVANYGSCTRPSILSKKQERELLACFDRRSPEGKRDHAMTLCMLHLGLRAVEVVRLRLGDVDSQNRCLRVPPAKMGRGRVLPIPSRVLAALLDYVTNGRPESTGFDQLFLRHPRRRGYPLSQAALKHTMIRAYRRCGFPRSWCGTHRLRHTFASRLHQRGADLKPIADLLGHRHLDSATVYTHIAPQALQALAQPWPW